MPDGTDYQVVDVLMLVANVAPIALYFLILGLVNSHSRPFLVTSRSDFLLLTIVLVPLLMWPLPALLQARGGWALVAAGVVASVVFWRLLPRRGAGFVLYNISEDRCARILADTLRSMGLSGHWDGTTWRCNDGDISVHLSGFTLLRNVSIHVESHRMDAANHIDRIGAELNRRLASVAQLPSLMGACLVVLGVSLLIVPMWMVGQHMHDLVDAMSHLIG